MVVQTVAVLMTDLVDSTETAARLGPDAAEKLRVEHFKLLRGAVERAEGSEVKGLGDGLMVVFPNASAALACAVEMQQAVDANNRRSQERCEIRVGASFGEATFERGDYYGEAVVEAARLCAQANGGQIIVTDLLRQVAGSRDAHCFEPVGSLALKGLSEPVAAHEVSWEPLLAGAIALPEALRELPALGYVGRASEREQISGLWRDACQGSLQVVLIAGEAGVGKTRLSTHLGSQVHADGATVLYGRCDEDLGVPYQPWAQALDHLVRGTPRSILDWHVERHEGDLTRLVPALRERVPGAAPRQSDPETERYMLYGAAAGLIGSVGEQAPLLLILDDLHWADAPTISLLRHVVAARPAAAVMIIGTYRDTDLSHDHPLVALLADLHRERDASRMKLTGLLPEDVLALIEAAAGHVMDREGRELADQITRESSGNPFFVGELLRHLRESGFIVQGEQGRWRLAGEPAELGLPQSVREVVGRRVERLGADARTALSAAAVIGHNFDSELLQAVLELDDSRLIDLLDAAVQASLLRENQLQAGRYSFTHALVEHALYEGLGSTRRARLHRRVGEAIEQQCGDDPGDRLGELAAHWAAAVIGTDTSKARHYAQRAADRALTQLAPDEAARWYGKSLELMETSNVHERAQRCELLIGLGEAERQVGDPAFRRTLLQAASLAQELGDPDRLSRSVLANNRGWSSKFGEVDSERVGALEAAADALAEDDPRRPEVLALLACELQFAEQPERCEQLAAGAIELARATGDLATLAHTMADAGWAIVAPHTLHARRQMIDELSELALRLEDPRLSARAAARRVLVGLEVADRSLVETGLATLRSVAETVPEPWITYLRPLLEFGWSLLAGDLATAEEWATRAYDVGLAAGQPDAGLFFGAHLFHVRYFQGRAGELLDQVEGLGGDGDELTGWRGGAVALALIQSGRTEDARALALAERFTQLARSEAWAIVMLLWADACSRLRLVPQAAEMYELLQPFSGQLAVSGAHVYGTIDWALGSLATTLTRFDEADRHFHAAAEIATRLGAPLLLARTQARWSLALILRGRPEDLERAQQMLEQASSCAAERGADGIMLEVAEYRGDLAAVGG